ncbi:MAG: hypothetical protein QM533_05230 [Cytophagales bacterium]|nr:hypothetical protein [Cytophagales bacterium]
MIDPSLFVILLVAFMFFALRWTWKLAFDEPKMTNEEYQKFLNGLNAEQRMQWAFYKLQWEQGNRTQRELENIASAVRLK